MFGSNRFFQGVLIGALVLSGMYLVAYFVLSRVGEIGLDSIISRQISDPKDKVLFLSGLNQYSSSYKFKLMGASKPKVIALGSSRAMQVRELFFNVRFTNLGGAVNSISELETFANRLAGMQDRPDMTLLFLDPWWFNREFTDQEGSYQLPEFPKMISTQLLIGAAALFRKGNWLTKAMQTKNLGIQAILSGDGFSKDGSYHYVAISSGSMGSTDVQFLDTLARIAAGRSRFEKSEHASSSLIARACSAISAIKSSGTNLILIAPPFSNVIWNKLREGGYNYIDEAYARIVRCSKGVDFYDFTSAAKVPGSTDCEFIDGFHGGDVTAARMLQAIGAANPVANNYLAVNFVSEFIQRNSGYSGGITRLKFLNKKEIDFLKIGCTKL